MEDLDKIEENLKKKKNKGSVDKVEPKDKGHTKSSNKINRKKNKNKNKKVAAD